MRSLRYAKLSATQPEPRQIQAKLTSRLGIWRLLKTGASSPGAEAIGRIRMMALEHSAEVDTTGSGA
jgi:hypothetical protein